MTDEERERIAREALREITPDTTVGELMSRSADADEVVTLSFEATMIGYPGWHWTVSLAELPGEAPTVLEAELLPGDGALLAPDWIPWADRLEDYRAAQAAAAAAAAEADDEELDDEDLDEHDDDLDDDAELDEHDDDRTDLDEDFGDDPDDGIDFEHDDSAVDADADAAAPSAPAEPMGVDETGEPEADADEAGPEPVDAAGLDERADEDQ